MKKNVNMSFVHYMCSLHHAPCATLCQSCAIITVKANLCNNVVCVDDVSAEFLRQLYISSDFWYFFHFLTHFFGMLCFLSTDTFVDRLFVEVILSKNFCRKSFCRKAFRRQDISSTGHFVDRAFRRQDNYVALFVFSPSEQKFKRAI